MKEISLTQSPTNALAACLERNGGSNGVWGIIKISLNGSYSPTSISNMRVSYNNEKCICAGLYMKTASEYYAYISFATSQVQKLAKILPDTYTLQYLTLPVSGGSMTKAIFISDQVSYYIGNL